MNRSHGRHANPGRRLGVAATASLWAATLSAQTLPVSVLPAASPEPQAWSGVVNGLTASPPETITTACPAGTELMVHEYAVRPAYDGDIWVPLNEQAR